MVNHVLSGVDQLPAFLPSLRGCRVGLMTNPTGIDHQFRSTIDLVFREGCLSALFAVEHGIRGMQQAGDAVGNTTDPVTNVTVYSAYGTASHFTEEMLNAFDTLIFDMQDVGARFYTYLYSLSYAMIACARAGKRIIVLDRVNPLGGEKRSGTILDSAFASFVGNYELPTQYGLTIGEYARYVKWYLNLNLDMTILPLRGWKRSMLLSDTDLPWVAPSPNCPDLAAALCYTGTCIFEGSNISEGRGTTQPFQLVGAPFLNANLLADRMNALNLEGIHFRPAAFVPTFSKYQGEVCHGVQMHITDPLVCDTFAGGLLLMDEIRRQAGNAFSFLRWNQDPKYAIDKLMGTDVYRTGKKSAMEVIEEGRAGIRKFSQTVQPCLLYS